MLEPIDALLQSTLGSPALLDGYLYPFILEGFALTLKLALASLALAVALGMVGAVAKLSRSRLARGTAGGVYTTVVRGVPDIVLMFILFFGGQIFVNYCGAELTDLGESAWICRSAWDYVEISEFAAGTFSIGFVFGAYMAETFRGGILAVSRGEIEAGHAFGMTPAQVFFRSHVAVERAPCPAELRQQLAGARQGHRPRVRHRAAGHGVPSLAGGKHAPRAVHVLHGGGGALPAAHRRLRRVCLRWLNRRYSVGVREA